MKFTNNIRGVAQKISATFLLLAVVASPFSTLIPVADAAPKGSGAIWTTTGSCGAPQNINQYAVGETVFINGSNFTASTQYPWKIQATAGGANGVIIASGTLTTNASGALCIPAKTLTNGDIGGPYNAVVDGKNDNFSVGAGVAQTGNITIVKSVNNASGNTIDFPFTSNVIGNTAFTLKGGASKQLLSQDAGSYTFTEGTMPSGWNFASVSCDSGTWSTSTKAVTITLAGGNNVTCTFNNTLPVPTVDLSVAKTVDDNTPNENQQITYTISYTNQSANNATGVTISDALPAGVTYVSSSLAPVNANVSPIVWNVGTVNAGANGSFTVTVSVNSATGGQTITNTATVDATENDTDSSDDSSTVGVRVNVPPPTTGTFNISKILGNLFGAAFDLNDFSFSINGGTAVFFNSLGDASVTLEQGSYNVAETLIPGFLAPTYGVGCTATGTFSVVAGQDTNCIITNTADQPTLTLQKEVFNNSTPAGTAVAANFTLTASGTIMISGVHGASVVTNAPVMVGTYDLSESGPAGYTASDWACTGGTQIDGDTVSIALGQDVTCVITNNDNDPTKSSITVNKVLVQNYGGTLATSSFQFSMNGGTATAFETDGSNALGDFGAGAYTIVETNPAAGYSVSTSSCAFTLVPGGAYTCTITNTELPACSNGLDDDNDGAFDNGSDTGCSSDTDDNEQAGGTLTINKEVTGQGASTTQTFNFDYGWNGAGTDAALSADGAPITIANLEEGTYTFEEVSIPSRWAVSSIACVSGNEIKEDTDLNANSATINLVLDENVTCTVTNNYTPRDDSSSSSDGGGGGGNGVRISLGGGDNDDEPEGEVLGDSDAAPEVKGAVAPVGAPNTGFGGAATGNTFALIMSFLGFLLALIGVGRKN